jgi:hypothetical protein
MKELAKARATITVRLTEEQHTVLKRLCRLKRMTQAGYLTSLATEQAQQELTAYAVREYLDGRASISELATKTGLDVPTIMEAAAAEAGTDRRAVEAFLSAAKSLADAHADPEFYELAVKAAA